MLISLIQLLLYALDSTTYSVVYISHHLILLSCYSIYLWWESWFLLYYAGSVEDCASVLSVIESTLRSTYINSAINQFRVQLNSKLQANC